jgi:hypothetical protein
MSKIFKRYQILPTIIALSLFVIFLGVDSTFAQTGESIVKCGQGSTSASACKISDIGTVVKGAVALVVSIGIPLLFIFVSARFIMAWFARAQGNANAYKEAIQKAGQAVFGLIIVVLVVGGGLYTILSVFGVKPELLIILKMFTLGDMFQHTYAQSQTFINPIQSNTLYDFILSAARLVMKFFIYPALIVIWVWTGFSFVLAQGAPEALAKAKKWLIGAVITTLIIMVLQGFLLALQNSVNKILGGTATATAGQSCKMPDGSYGQMGTDGACRVGGAR